MTLHILNGVKENEEREKVEAQRLVSLLELLDLCLRRTPNNLVLFKKGSGSHPKSEVTQNVK